jgi:hypothetical protein
VKILYLLLAALAVTGCNRAGENKEAIRQGVVEYISSRANVSAMEVDVTSIAFRGSEADATVSFRAKGAPASSGVQMNYTLENKAGKWVVKGKAEKGGGHGAGAMGGGMPGAMPGEGGGNPHSGMMGDPGTTPKGEMPPGHPSIPEGKAGEGGVKK